MPDATQNGSAIAPAYGDRSDAPPADPSRNSASEETDAQRAARAEVKCWIDRIKKRKKACEKDFKRMEKGMAFASGLQWDGQDSIDFDKYVANITLRSISQKVSTLYARDPQAVCRRRERLDYQLWDGKMESIIAAMGVVQQSVATLGPQNAPPEALALLQDFQNGQAVEQMLDKVARTIKILYHYQMDEQEPEYKEQLKQLVTMVCTCGVGYARMSFVRDQTIPIGSTSTGDDTMNRLRSLKTLIEKYEKGDCGDSSPVAEQIRLLAQSLAVDAATNTVEAQSVTSERLVWDFPAPTQVIVDGNCTSLMNFVGANWLAIEYLLPIEAVNSYFELRGDSAIKLSSEIRKYNEEGKEMETGENESKADSTEKALCCLYEVFNKRDKTRFFVVDGYKDYAQPPAPVSPKIRRFFPLFALTFNRIATDKASKKKTSIYPPSDVDLLRSMQKEWNRDREGLRTHRKQNQPGWVASKGAGLTETDKEKIRNMQPGEVIELAGVQPGQDIRQVIMAFPTQEIQPQVYDTSPLLQDVNLVIGAQAADLGAQRPDETATGQQISEQARLSTTASNVDDLDGFLTRMARAGGEMLLREMSPQFVTQIVGPGAVWPSTDTERENFINALFLETQAASSGRPNGALEMKQWQAAAPVLQAAGANPQFMVRKTLDVLDSRIEPAEAFPLLPPAPPKQNMEKPTQPNEQTGGPQPQADHGKQPENPRNQQQQPTL